MYSYLDPFLGFSLGSGHGWDISGLPKIMSSSPCKIQKTAQISFTYFPFIKCLKNQVVRADRRQKMVMISASNASTKINCISDSRFIGALLCCVHAAGVLLWLFTYLMELRWNSIFNWIFLETHSWLINTQVKCHSIKSTAGLKVRCRLQTAEPWLRQSTYLYPHHIIL